MVLAGSPAGRLDVMSFALTVGWRRDRARHPVDTAGAAAAERRVDDREVVGIDADVAEAGAGRMREDLLKRRAARPGVQLAARSSPRNTGRPTDRPPSERWRRRPA